MNWKKYKDYYMAYNTRTGISCILYGKDMLLLITASSCGESVQKSIQKINSSNKRFSSLEEASEYIEKLDSVMLFE